jgi:ABC-type Fe3+/spermidine/putrescine transport system ATPase subunit
MIELEIKARRGNFHLDIACRFVTPWTVIFGPSGAGKSTLLRLIAGLDKPDYGRIAVHGRYLTDTEIGLDLLPGALLPGALLPGPLRPGAQHSQRSTGMVTQQSALFPHLDVTANVAYGLPHLNGETRNKQVIAMLEQVGAAHLANRMPRALSGGEAQRVSLARALAPMPQLLLLDEPLSALDASARDEVLTRLQRWLNEQKILTILVTHDAADALATEAEVALMHEGKLIALGPASQVLAAERTRLLARLNQA